MRGSSARGFTLVDALAVVAVAAIAGAIGGVHAGDATGQPAEESALVKARRSARQIKDSSQLRGICQALIVFAQNNGDRYPLPSQLDKLNQTVREEGVAKDTSANLMSILVWGGFVPVEMLVSPVEVNKQIAVYENFEYDQPKAAVNPANALWDPAFHVDFTSGKKGGLSYAHLQPIGERMSRWSNTFVSTEAVLSMRGPEIMSVTRNEDGSTLPKFANETSHTFGMYAPPGEKAAWSGNVVFNDNHVDFVAQKLAPGKSIPFDAEGRNYKDAEGKDRTDIWCYDEPDDPKSVNDFLGIFVRAGKTPADFKAIWD